jgi:catalase
VYYAITAFKFTNAAGQSRFGRFRLRPEAGTEFLSAEQAAQKTSDFLAAELAARLGTGPVGFRVLVQLAEPRDTATDSTSLWPESRPLVDLAPSFSRSVSTSWPPSGGRSSLTPCRAWTGLIRPAIR